MRGSEIDIVHESWVRSYRTWEQDQIVSYTGFNERKGKKSKRGSPTCLHSEVKSERNITPPSGSTSAVTSLVLVHEDPQPGPVDCLNPLINSGSSHAASASSYSQLPLPDIVLDLPKFLILTLQLLPVDSVALYLR